MYLMNATRYQVQVESMTIAGAWTPMRGFADAKAALAYQARCEASGSRKWRTLDTAEDLVVFPGWF